MKIRIPLWVCAAIVGCLVVGVGGSGKAAEPDAAKVEPAMTAPGLRLTVGKAGAGTLEVTLENKGAKPLVLNMGLMVGNGRALLPNAVSLVVTGLDAKERKLMRGSAAVAGRLDDYLVPMPVGAKYSLMIRVRDWAGEDGFTPGVIVAGEQVRAVYEGAEVAYKNQGSVIPGLPMWVGKVESERVKYAE
jgi:hypothetical protein